MVRTPSRRAVRMIRRAISPRLAISSDVDHVGSVPGRPARLAPSRKARDALLALVARPGPGRCAGRCRPSERGRSSRPATSVDQPLGLGHRAGRAGHDVGGDARLRRRPAPPRRRPPRRPGRSRGRTRRRTTRPVANRPPRPARADGGDDVGADGRRDQAELDLGEGEPGVRRRRWPCRRPPPAPRRRRTRRPRPAPRSAPACRAGASA